MSKRCAMWRLVWGVGGGFGGTADTGARWDRAWLRGAAREATPAEKPCQVGADFNGVVGGIFDRTEQVSRRARTSCPASLDAGQDREYQAGGREAAREEQEVDLQHGGRHLPRQQHAELQQDR